MIENLILYNIIKIPCNVIDACITEIYIKVDNKNINMGGTPGTARAFKMCLCEHEEDNARYGRVSIYKNIWDCILSFVLLRFHIQKSLLKSWIFF